MIKFRKVDFTKAEFVRIEILCVRTNFCGQNLKTSILSERSKKNKALLTEMALRGVWQLKKVVVSYCNWGGSSRGIRAFMESELPAFKEKNPQLDVVTELNRGQHPFLKGLYKNKNERVVCVKNLSQDEVLEAATKLRNSLGRKVVKLKTRHVTKQPSVQGTWSTALEL
ncbi:large ribosomal subunit protein mL43-like isoform X1 [Lycium barbarum]|uniref:large ribosomal subunit protein mL43-like isoform X1 n=2 Tax=Lycium barbarum TaxID=112863 RepID=UPI00293EFE36|nr:large ribosomal subunit protein mL43-like isoform X1 [Lycium barbarum]